MITAETSETRWSIVKEELVKLPAFFRRDLLVAWSYRVAFFTDWISLAVQVVIFALIGRMVDPQTLPSYDGEPTSYVAFVIVGIAVTSFMQVALGKVVNALRNEQLMGTLETVLTTPTSAATIQLGSVMYDLVYVPIRTVLFLVLASTALGVQLSVGGFGPALVVLMAFIPVVWGLGIASAAAVLTLRRGAGIVGLAVSALTIGSTTYFPLDVLPSWAQTVVALNPLTMTLETARNSLLGSGAWADIWTPVASLIPMAAVSLVAGVAAFRWALRRERRKGTLALY
jgi:ABC-type polysaccharide/polyol phosphate export permease